MFSLGPRSYADDLWAHSDLGSKLLDLNSWPWPSPALDASAGDNIPLSCRILGDTPASRCTLLSLGITCIVHLVSGFSGRGTTFCIASNWAPELRGPVVPAV